VNPLDAIRVVARALSDLGVDDAVFVGGAVVGLLLTDPAAPPARATDDVDVVIGETSRVAFARLEARLRDAGHVQPMPGPICRWQIEGVSVDLMPIGSEVLGFTNRWYRTMMAHAVAVELRDERTVRVLSAPYLIATKLEAFHDRGAGDYLLSRDLGDIIALVDGREEVVEEVRSSDAAVRAFITNTFRDLLSDPAFIDSLSAHLMPDAASQDRVPVVVERMRRIVAASFGSGP